MNLAEACQQARPEARPEATVVYISGKARAGKDTFATYLKECLERNGKKVLIFHYADLVKQTARQYFGWNGEKDEAGRTLLQRIGTDEGRKSNPDIWANWFKSFYQAFGSNWDFIIVPDVRFHNELPRVRNCPYGLHFRMVRDIDNGLSEEQKSHPSETELDSCAPDFWINNNRGMAELYLMAENAAYSMLGAPKDFVYDGDAALINAERIQTLSSEILNEFEALLDEKNIIVPCADACEERIRGTDTARLFGTEYFDLADAIEAILAEG